MNQESVTKKCPKCQKIKPLDQFHKSKVNKDGCAYQCKQCYDLYYKTYIQKNRIKLINKSKKYYKSHSDNLKKQAKKYREIHKEHYKKYNKNYRLKNLKRLRILDKKYYQDNKKKIYEYRLKKWGKHQKPPSQKWRITKEYFKWVSLIYKKANFKCENCNRSGCKLFAHHIKPASEYPTLRFNIKNGKCLCEECHKNIHFPKNQKA